MVKVLTFLKRKARMSVEEFPRHWQDPHAKILAGIPGLRRCVLSAPRRDRSGFLAPGQPEHVIVA